MRDLDHAQWRKSRHSGAGNACIELTELTDGSRALRDSKDPSGPTLRFSPASWAAFTTRIHAGEFD